MLEKNSAASRYCVLDSVTGSPRSSTSWRRVSKCYIPEDTE
jgi:hypothetical protein